MQLGIGGCQLCPAPSGQERNARGFENDMIDNWHVIEESLPLALFIISYLIDYRLLNP